MPLSDWGTKISLHSNSNTRLCHHRQSWEIAQKLIVNHYIQLVNASSNLNLMKNLVKVIHYLPSIYHQTKSNHYQTSAFLLLNIYYLHNLYHLHHGHLLTTINHQFSWEYQVLRKYHLHSTIVQLQKLTT